ncbi:MAG: hypothetical protein V4772_08750 [Pseudomonadota bacterium]
MTRAVPEHQWPTLLELLSPLTPVNEDLGTHCYDRHFELDGKTYIVTYQYGFDVPIDICVKV